MLHSLAGRSSDLSELSRAPRVTTQAGTACLLDRVGTPCIGRPSLRTEQADFRHSALQLVVNFQEDWQAT
jgi:hypothetical protein